MARPRNLPGSALIASRLSSVDTISGIAVSPAARPFRFLAVGALTFVVQVGLLLVLTSFGLQSLVAWAIALALAVQFNFLVNQLLVWHDRPIELALRPIVNRWVSFHVWISLSLVVNMAAFALAHLFVPDVVAAVIAVAASTGFKFLSLDRFAFRQVRSQ